MVKKYMVVKISQFLREKSSKRRSLTTGEVYRVLTGGAEEVTGVGSALGYIEYEFFCLCKYKYRYLAVFICKQVVKKTFQLCNPPCAPSPQPHFGTGQWPVAALLPLEVLLHLSLGASDERTEPQEDPESRNEGRRAKYHYRVIKIHIYMCI